MQINENTNMYATVVLKEGDQETPVVNLAANMMQNATSFNISVNIINPTLVAANSAFVQGEINSFMNIVRQKLIDNEYPITI